MKKAAFISIIITLAFLTGCKKNSNNPVSTGLQNSKVSFQVNCTDYSDSEFLLDSVYGDTSDSLNIFSKYFGRIIPQVINKYKIIKAQIYIAENNIISQNSIIAKAYINLPSRTKQQLYSDLYRNSNIDTAGTTASAHFILLTEGTDYYLEYNTGWLSLNFEPKEGQTIAVAYEIMGDNPGTLTSPIFGEFWDDIINNKLTPGVLKLIKPSNLSPVYEKAWKLKMKNIYKITNNTDKIEQPLVLQIYLINNHNVLINNINNTSFLQLFGFDNYDLAGNTYADGLFDFRPYLDLIPSAGKIIFPVLEPFGKQLPSQIDNTLKDEDIYTKPKSSLDTSHIFILRGDYSTRALDH